MICPQTKAECQFSCKDIAGCQLQLAPYEFCDTKKTISISSDGEVVADPCVTSFRVQPSPSGWVLKFVAIQKPPKPTMAEIERLVLSLRQSSFDLGELVWKNATIKLVRKARKIDEQNCAALLTAIRDLSNSTQEGE